MKDYNVYIIKENGITRYVGCSCNIKRRIIEHTYYPGTRYSAIPLDSDLKTIEINIVATFDNEYDAKVFENELIIKYNTIKEGCNKIHSGHIHEDVNAYNRQYYNTNIKFQEHCKEQAKKRYKNKHEERLTKSHAYYQANKEKIKEQRRKRYRIQKYGDEH